MNIFRFAWDRDVSESQVGLGYTTYGLAPALAMLALYIEMAACYFDVEKYIIPLLYGIEGSESENWNWDGNYFEKCFFTLIALIALALFAIVYWR